jgi:hypothetical protein
MTTDDDNAAGRYAARVDAVLTQRTRLRGPQPAGTVGVVAGIIVATVVVGELAPRLVSVLALDYSEER